MRLLDIPLKWIVHHHALALVLSLLMFLPFLLAAPKVKKVSSVDDFKLDRHPDFIFYDHVKEVFGNDEFFVIAFERETVFSADTLNILSQITDELEAMEEIRKVKSLSNIDYLEGGEDYFEVRKFLSEIPEETDKLNELARKATDNELYISNLISQDAKTTAIVVYAYDRQEDTDYREILMAKTEAVLDKYRNQNIVFHLSGWTKINNDLTASITRDTDIFIPITYLLISVMVWLFYRNIRLTIIAILNITVCLFSTIGLFAISGIPLNNVTSLVPSLIMALSLSDTVHIFSHLNEKILLRYKTKQEALLATLKQVATPCFLTTVTTAVGFVSLMVNELAPIKHFGLIAALGMLFEFLFSFLFLPSLLLFCDPGKIFIIQEKKQGKMNRFLSSLLVHIKQHKIPIITAGIFISLTAAYFLTTIRIETNFVEYFKQKSEIRTAINFVEKRLSGVESLDISFQSQESDAFLAPDNLKLIEEIQHFLESQDGVDLSTSLTEFVKDMHRAFHNGDNNFYKIPDSKPLIAQYMLLYDSDEIEEFVNGTYTHSKISARLSIHSSADQEKLINRVAEFIENMDKPDTVEIRITGRSLESVRVIDSLVKGQVSSLMLASAVIGLCMLIVLKSLTLGLLSFSLNLFPILINFGFMGITGIPLNTATALISAVALGIVVDDTIHFVSEYNRQRQLGEKRLSCVERVMIRKGRAIITTSVILSAGFGVLAFSNFVPTIQFGFLSAFIMLTAVIGDLVVLPAILLCNTKETKVSSPVHKIPTHQTRREPGHYQINLP